MESGWLISWNRTMPEALIAFLELYSNISIDIVHEDYPTLFK